MPGLAGFRVYYDDGSTYEGDPYLTPAYGVICILDSHGQVHIDENRDYYVWHFRENGWTGVDLFGLFDYLAQPGYRKVIFGRLVANDIFEEIHLRALREMMDHD